MKQNEFALAFHAGRLSGEEWHFLEDDRESPDFLISACGDCFGLEVTECHVGPVGKDGSRMRKKESFNERWLNDIREEFEKEDKDSASVRYHGPASATARAAILLALRSDGFRQKTGFETLQASICGSGRLFAHRARHSSWGFADDRTGPTVVGDAALQAVIERKAKRLEAYKRVTSDVRLLVVADTIFNSGRLALSKDFSPSLLGFSRVYFFQYPSLLTTFS